VSRMPISPLWSILFFLMLLSLGFGTQFSTTETVVTIIQDMFPGLRGKNRRWVLLFVCAFMYLAGLSMITEGGMYVLQLIDNHSATYSALILGCCEVSVMSWCYGVDRFLEDLKFMLGFYPYPRLFWKWAWKLVSPLIVMFILVFTWVDYNGNSYGDYQFPAWANTLGWLITFSSVSFIPLVAIIKLTNEEGTLASRLCKLTQPSYDWGPASSQPRRLNGGDRRSFDPGYHGMNTEIDGSHTTLITNASNSNIIKEMKENSFAHLEPLRETYEEDGSSEDDGLNMKVIRQASAVSNTTETKTTNTTSNI